MLRKMNKLICKIFGHRMLLTSIRGACGPARCKRCGFLVVGLTWPPHP